MTVLSNVHTHTSFCDGSSTAEEMVLSAIEQGCDTLGFSGHSYLGDERCFDWAMSAEGQRAYREEITRLKREYSDKLHILLGLELDCFSKKPKEKYDYIIGSVHAVKKNGVRFDVDCAPQLLQKGIEELYGGETMDFVRDYYALVADVVNRTDCDIIGHFDLILKFNDSIGFVDTSSKEYRNTALEALDALIETGKMFEINTGAISRGWRLRPYPEDFILKRLAEKKANVIITSDSHHKDTVCFGFDAAVEYAKSCGIKELCVYFGKKVNKIPI